MAWLKPSDTGGTLSICLACLGMVGIFALTGFIFRRITASRLSARPERKQELYLTARRFASTYKGLLLASYFVILSLLNWQAMSEILAPPGRIIFLHFVLKMLPFFVLLLLSWLIYYGIEKALSFRPWTLGQYLSFQIRQALVIVVPLLGFNFLIELVGTFSGTEDYLELYPELMIIAFIPMMAVVYTLIPLLARFLWTVESFPRGYLRGRLESLCRKHGVKVRDILLWRTGRASIINAAVLGLFGPLRYVIITDGLLRHLSDTEVEAVFGHELGHARHHHIAIYASFLIVISFATMVIMTPLTTGNGLIDGIMQIIITFGIFIGLVFGFISRRFERQADLFGCKVVGDTMVFVNALEKVALHSGNIRRLPSWMHSSIEKRVTFLIAAMHNPAIAAEFQRKAKALALGIVGAFVLCIAGVSVSYITTSREERLLQRTGRFEDLLTGSQTERDKMALHIRLAGLYERAGEYRKAARHYDAFFSNEVLARNMLRRSYGDENSSQLARDLRDTGRLFLDEGYVETAAPMIRLAIQCEKDNQENVELARELARKYFRVLEDLLAQGARERSELDVSRLEATRLDRLLEFEAKRALPTMHAVWSLAPKDPELLRMLGRTYLMGGSYRDAAYFLGQAAQSAPSEDTLIRYGLALGFADDITSAQEVLFGRFRNTPQDDDTGMMLEEARRRVALHYSLTASPDDMFRRFASWGRQEGAASRFAHFARAEMLYLAGDLDAAGALYRAAVGAFPENACYRYRLAEFYLQRGKYEQACEQFERAALQSPERADYFDRAAYAFRANGETKRAETYERIARILAGEKGSPAFLTRKM